NVMIGEGEHALIMDFGIARAATPGGAAPPPSPAAPQAASGGTRDGASVDVTLLSGAASDNDVTIAPRPITSAAPAGASMAQGAIIGTLEYMAPEQARGQNVDQRADIYAFGMIVSQMLIGPRPVPDGMTPIEALWQRVGRDPVSLRES